MKIYYEPKLKILAKQLRKNSTSGEILLWQQLKKKQQGFKFHRQKPIGRYIVDFYAPQLHLIIEVDGCTHDNRIEADQIRQKKLEDLGLSVLRIQEKDVYTNLD